ncbi:hypothetical protein DPMN_023643 [Dreissena polymorpha]|uniref:Uncharacterized protein n=1 Tax=Dreissena polymorpha TaxID=45954 RepID=A0A9D4LMI4_DREPO|nr:hypothetical protein DPMN_023643 [Dreissena polymorpha]
MDKAYLYCSSGILAFTNRSCRENYVPSLSSFSTWKTIVRMSAAASTVAALKTASSNSTSEARNICKDAS